MNCRSFIDGLNPSRMFSVLGSRGELIWKLTQRNIVAEVKGSILGVFWTVLNPLLMLAVYAVVFGLIFGARFEQSPNPSAADYVLGLFLGLALYRLVADVLLLAPRLIVNQSNYVKKVVFPLEVLPVSLLCVGIYRFLITLLLLCAGVVFFGRGFDWSVLLFPLCVCPIVLLTLGIAYFVSSLGVFFRDLAQVTGVLSVVLLYASGVFYPAAKVQLLAPEIWMWLKWNPILLSIEASRRVLLWGQLPSGVELLYVWLVSVFVCLMGYRAFAKLRPAFADVL